MNVPPYIPFAQRFYEFFEATSKELGIERDRLIAAYCWEGGKLSWRQYIAFCKQKPERLNQIRAYGPYNRFRELHEQMKYKQLNDAVAYDLKALISHGDQLKFSSNYLADQEEILAQLQTQPPYSLTQLVLPNKLYRIDTLAEKVDGDPWTDFVMVCETEQPGVLWTPAQPDCLRLLYSAAGEEIFSWHERYEFHRSQMPA